MEVADTVRKATPDDLPQLSAALSRAFFDDPLMSWAIPDQDRRQRLEPEFFTLFTRAFLRHDQTYTTAGDVVGPRCGRHRARSRSAARTPRSWARGSSSWPDPTPHGSWGSTSCSTTTTRPAPTDTCSSWGSPQPGRAGASARP
jgi:hypothetical protein